MLCRLYAVIGCCFRSRGTSDQEATTKEITEVEESLKKIHETLPQPNKYVVTVYCDVG